MNQSRGWGLALGAGLAALVVLVLLLIFPRIVAVFHLYWGKDSIQQLLHDELGFSLAWSSFIGVVGQFIYALAWIPLTYWTYRLLTGGYDNRQLVVAFAAWVFVYGHAPLLSALFGTDACFNQRTGAPLKWYVQDADGRVVLFDSGGFDTVTRAEKRPVTPEICTTFARQKTSDRPRRITADVRQVEFFDPTSGRPRVWYHKARDGSFELFDAQGFHLSTSDPLLPVTREVASEIVGRIEKEIEEARRRREAEDVLRRAAAEETRQQEEIDARKRAEAERARREAEEAEARKQAAIERARREEEAQARRRAEEAETKRRANLINSIKAVGRYVTTRRPRREA